MTRPLDAAGHRDEPEPRGLRLYEGDHALVPAESTALVESVDTDLVAFRIRGLASRMLSLADVDVLANMPNPEAVLRTQIASMAAEVAMAVKELQASGDPRAVALAQALRTTFADPVGVQRYRNVLHLSGRDGASRLGEVFVHCRGLAERVLDLLDAEVPEPELPAPRTEVPLLTDRRSA